MDWLDIFSLNFKINDNLVLNCLLRIMLISILFENKNFDVLRFYRIVCLLDFP